MSMLRILSRRGLVPPSAQHTPRSSSVRHLACSARLQEATPLSSRSESIAHAHPAWQLGKETLQDASTLNTLLEQVRDGKTPNPIPTRLTPLRTWAEERRRLGLKTGDEQGDPQAELRKAVAEFEAQPLHSKKMSDSLVQLQLNFSKDPQLVERYIATSGKIRLGKIWEDMDGMAAAVSYLHAMGRLPSNQDQGSPVFTVTASVDRLELLRPLSTQCDYHLIGITIYAGTSSMEVLTAIEEVAPDGKRETVLTGIFTMVSRNALTLKAQQVAPLELASPEEKRLSELGREHKERKKAIAKTSLERLPPTQEEAKVLHEEYLRDRSALQASMARSLVGGAVGMLNQAGSSTVAPSEGLVAPTAAKDADVVAISSTTMSSTLHMHPQQKNAHLLTFGGTLIRHAYELAWMNAAVFANAPVTFLSLDTLVFHNPVPIGAVLSLTSTITYTSQRKIEREGLPGESPVVAAVGVWVEILDIETGARTRSNSFHFSFEIGLTKRRVAPYTYAEAIEWLESRRRVHVGDEFRQTRADGPGVPGS